MIFYLVNPLILISANSLRLLISPSLSLSPFVWVFILVPIINFTILTDLIDLLSKNTVPKHSLDCKLCKFVIKQSAFL